MVFALAGRLDDDELLGHVGEHVSAEVKRRRGHVDELVARQYCGSARADAPLQLRRRCLLAGAARPLPAAARRPREPPGGGRLRPGGQPHLELRPLAARVSRSGPKRQLYFMGKAELFNPVLGPIAARRRRVSRSAAARADVEAVEAAVRLCREGGDRGDVPGGHAPAEGPAQEVRAPAADRLGADRARPPACRSSLPRSRAWTGSSRLAEAQGRLRGAGPARRPRRACRRATPRPGRDRAADGARSTRSTRRL